MGVVWLLELFVSVGLVHQGPLSVVFHGSNRCGLCGRVPGRAPDCTHPHWNSYSSEYYFCVLTWVHVSFKDVAIQSNCGSTFSGGGVLYIYPFFLLLKQNCDIWMRNDNQMMLQSFFTAKSSFEDLYKYQNKCFAFRKHTFMLFMSYTLHYQLHLIVI